MVKFEKRAMIETEDKDTYEQIPVISQNGATAFFLAVPM